MAIPELVEVEFIEQWRGHDKGAVAMLTPERADQLIGEKICKKPGIAEKPRRGRPPSRNRPEVGEIQEGKPESAP